MLCRSHHDQQAGSFLKQQISMDLQIGNAACVLGTVSDRDAFEEIYYIKPSFFDLYIIAALKKFLPVDCLEAGLSSLLVVFLGSGRFGTRRFGNKMAEDVSATFCCRNVFGAETSSQQVKDVSATFCDFF